VENIPLPEQPVKYIANGSKESRTQFDAILANGATERKIPTFLKAKTEV